MPKHRVLSTLLFLLVFILVIVACGQPAQQAAQPTQAPAAQPAAPQPTQAPASSGAAQPTQAAPASGQAGGGKEIVLGAALPLTGGQAREGGLMKKGYDLAVKELNDAGGVMNPDTGSKVPVKLIVYDDKSDNTTSVSMYEKLVTEDKVDALLGGYGTPLIQAHTVIPGKYQIPYVNGGGATGAIYQRGNKWIFGLLASIEKLSNTLMDFLTQQQDAGNLPKPLKIAVVAENTSHGQEFRKGIDDRSKAAPDRFSVVVEEAFELNAKDFSPLLQKVKAANADVFLADARLADYTLMQRQYTEQGLKHKVISYGPRGAEKAARDALGPAADYIIACAWWAPDLPYPQVKAFDDRYKAAYNETPEWFAALAYETGRVMFKAIEQAGVKDKAKLRDALANMDFKDSIVVGQEVKFQPNGQINNAYVMTQNMPGGKAAIIYPKEVAETQSVVPIPAK